MADITKVYWRILKVNLPSKNAGAEGSATSLVGATKEDLKRLGLDNPAETINMAKKAAEKGGKLSMDDLMKLHGM